MYKKGTIILVPFPFTDLSQAKVRPALIISSHTLAGDDVTVMFISSATSDIPQSYDYCLKVDDKDFMQSGLKTDSTFKTAKIATLSKKIILGELGKLGKKHLEKINQKMRMVFEL